MNISTKNTILTAAVLAAMAFVPQVANAQTRTVNAGVTVSNALTVTVVDQLNFGTVAAIADATATATLTINPLTDALTHTTTGTPAVFAVIDGTAARAAHITVEDGADGATVNYTISNVVNPLFSARAFTLAGFNVSYNGGVATPRTAGTSFPHVFSSSFAAGVNTLDIGASLTTTAAAGTYADGTYAGSFDLTASY